MASSADVRDILALPSASTSVSAPRKLTSNAPKKPDGISREVYALIGDNSPSLVQQYAAPKLKQKPTFGKTQAAKSKPEKLASKWEWREFSNGSRQDGLKLSHWVKVPPESEETYQFEKYNTQSTVYVYSTDEYNKYLQDAEWSREETDYLFEVAREYDVRFFVMHDRYDFPGGVERTVEDLKHRYYGVCRKLLRTRPWGGDETTKAQLLSSFNFDKDRESTRKEYLRGLFNRTPAQIAEEEALYIEMKRLQQNEARFARDREDILRMLGGLDSGLANLNVDPDYFTTGPGSVAAGAVTQEKKKKRRDTSVSASGMDVDSPGAVTPGTNSLALLGLGPTNKGRKTDAKQAASDLLNCITRVDPPTNPTKSGHVAAHVRSSRIPTVRASTGVHTIVAELGLSHDRLVMPTRASIEKLESLQAAALGVVDLKRSLDRTRLELQVQKDRLEQGKAQPERESSAGPKKGRSRTPGEKQRKRSVSVSSTSTAATRGGYKRQRKDLAQ
ncbi:swr complex subunit [Ceratobasidium sp. 392]|nr:swr complex subunit [Ceratobasidium sp. 392]